MKLQGLADQLPFDLEAEKCVLGSLLRDPRRAAEISAKLKPDDFYAPRHRGLFGIMVGMETRSSGSCDPVTVAQEVDRLGREEELGGRPYLREAMEAVPSVAYLENHIRIVRDLAIRRELLNAAEEITRSIAAIDEEDVNILVDQAEQK